MGTNYPMPITFIFSTKRFVTTWIPTGKGAVIEPLRLNERIFFHIFFLVFRLLKQYRL